MRKTLSFGVVGLAAILAIAATGGGDAADVQGQEIPATANSSAVELRHAQRFVLAQAATHWWRAERPKYETGWLLVLTVDPKHVTPRNAEEAVLYVGDQTAERVNQGSESGRIVAIVPGEMPLTEAEIFFGSPGFPERIDAEQIARERVAARDAGVRPLGEDAIRAVSHDELRVADQYALFQKAIDLVETHSPHERDLIRSARVPQAK